MKEKESIGLFPRSRKQTEIAQKRLKILEYIRENPGATLEQMHNVLQLNTQKGNFLKSHVRPLKIQGLIHTQGDHYYLGAGSKKASS